jgi:hypothetical protein
LNAVPGTYLGNTPVTNNGPNAFVRKPITFSTNNQYSTGGIPRFALDVAGMDPNAAAPQTFMIDFFTSTYNLVFNTQCSQSLGGVSASCNAYPTLANNNWNKNYNSSGLIFGGWRYSYYQQTGYNTSGLAYSSRMCLPAEQNYCKLIYVYTATNIYADNWLYGQ